MFALRSLAPMLALFASFGIAHGKELKPVKTWMGRITMEQAKEGTTGSLFDEKALEKVWKAWKVKGEMPKVDFSKEFIIVVTSGGSGHGLNTELDDKGNLTTTVLATADVTVDLGFTVALFKREGIKTINGKPLPKE